MPLNIRFRTQDTRANWARKLNELFAPLTVEPLLREVPQTLEQWQHELNQAVATAVAANNVAAGEIVFRLGETRQEWARKLNYLSSEIQDGTD